LAQEQFAVQVPEPLQVQVPEPFEESVEVRVLASGVRDLGEVPVGVMDWVLELKALAG
jgi:hypothetical protein